MVKALKLGAFLAALGACNGVWAADAALAEPILSGGLPNGLHYVVVQHASAKGDIGLHLVVNVGSLDESDDERGFAHFVEHMAFNGSRNHPAGTLRQLFQTLGLSFGADLNASTGYTYTNYLLDLPDNRASSLDLALDVFRDYADGLQFPAAETSRESGVVISELKARDSAGRRAGTQLIDVLFAGTQLPHREVGGQEEILRKATPDLLRKFYEHHYAPERMTVVVVGPLEPASVVEHIRDHFTTLAPRVDSVLPAPAPNPTTLAGAKADVLVMPTAKGATVRFLSLSSRPPDTLAGRRVELARRLATAALYGRLRSRREREDFTQFAPPQVRYEPTPFGLLVQHEIDFAATISGWDTAVELVGSELHRARVNGFTPAEIAEAAAGQLTYARNQIAEFSGKPAAKIAAEVASQIMNGRTWRLPAEELAEAESLLASIEAKEVSAQVELLFPPDALHIVLTVPPDNPVKADRVLSVYKKITAREVKTSNASEQPLVFKYTDFGKTGALVKQERVEDLDLTLVKFANDVQMNLRPSKFEPERFRARVVFPSNYSDVSPDSGGVAELAGQVFQASDLRHQPQTELQRLLKIQGVSTQFVVSNGTPVFTMSGPSSALEFSLRFLTALLSDLKFDLEHYRVALSQYAGFHQSVRTTPAPFAIRAAFRAFAGNDNRFNLTPPQNFANDAGFDAASVWLRDHVLDAPLEIGLVGDFTSEDTIKLGAATIGTLRKRKLAKHGTPLSSPQKPIRQAGSAELPASTSLFCVLWPVALPDNPKSNASVALAVDVLRDRATVVLREALGATYSPDARFFRDAVQRDLAFVGMVNTFDPEKSDRLSIVSLAVGAQLAGKGVTSEEFDRLKEPLRSRREQDMRNNGWWLNSVSVAQTHPEILAELRQHTSVIEEITIEDLNRALQIYKPDRFVSVLLHPASANIPPPSKGRKKSGDDK